ncbi:MAG: hypothetical protein JO327_13920, partial [Nitrososphaeraceae archaeon]|nr:hypothetical protein [Nitrososphaeraceae archaeon]
MRSDLHQKSTIRTNTSIQHSFAIVIIILAVTASLLVGAYDTQTQFVKAVRPPWPAVSMAVSNSNLYIAWMSNDTGHWNVFFAKSADGGKTFNKSIILNVLNTGNTINANTHISASGNNVYVTWWTNQKASSDLVFSPSFRASNGNGSTFGNIVMLNKNGSAT